MTTAQIAAPLRPEPASSTAMDLLRRGIPLSLLLDLALGPFSEDLLLAEAAATPEVA